MADRTISMTSQPSPEQIEYAIELVRYLDPVRAHSVVADTDLSAHGIDGPACFTIALEIESCFGMPISEAAVEEWRTVHDVACAIASAEKAAR